MKFFTRKFDRIILWALTAAVCGSVFYTCAAAGEVRRAMAPAEQKVVAIDPGHGGWDPGKSGTSGEDEKDINLSISLLLGKYLQLGGAEVVYTRTEDEALGSKKRSDMDSRKEIIDGCGADILICIHQNAFTSSGVKGAQVFYYGKSEDGRALAEAIQKSLVENVDPKNTRAAKSNTSYYILKNTHVPAAIVECGFLSNPGEEAKLNSEEYQEKLAWAIYIGIIDYFSVDKP